MTEQEWLNGADPEQMLKSLRAGAWYSTVQGRLVHGNDRKLRLFAAGCCRLLWHLLTDGRSREAVRIAEECADGTGGEEVRVRAAARAFDALLSLTAPRGRSPTQVSRRESSAAGIGPTIQTLGDLEMAHQPPPPGAEELAARTAFALVAWGSYGASAAAEEGLRLMVKGNRADSRLPLLRCIFGNPFRPVSVDPAWLRWSGGAIRKLAQLIYGERRGGDLPILADALEEAGCTDTDILAHCRSGDLHPRGCWVLDGLLARSQYGREQRP